MYKAVILFLFTFIIWWHNTEAQETNLSTVGSDGWANNSVNTVVFRKNSLTTLKDMQYTAYYDSSSSVIVAKRKIGSSIWETARTEFKGDATDAHKAISIAIDGDGYLHLSWGQHNSQLNYVKSQMPYSLSFTGKLKMIGNKENKVSYPEFYKLENGNLLFFYREGGSGNGNMLLNLYNTKTKCWIREQDNLIDGEGKRNAYWQIAIDSTDIIHLSWVWRENPNVSSNHDLCYACSKDGGKTWENSLGKKYRLPITIQNAEYACRISQHRELINQTSMFVDKAGSPFIATYYKDGLNTLPQYHVIFKKGRKWQDKSLSFRKSDFTLNGIGTKHIPISRPQIIGWSNEGCNSFGLIFRDQDLGNRLYLAVVKNINHFSWKLFQLDNEDLGGWEPTYDSELWRSKHILSLFLENVIQIDGEGNKKTKAQKIQVLDFQPAQF